MMSLNLSLRKKRSKHNKKITKLFKIVKLPITKLLVFFFARQGLSDELDNKFVICNFTIITQLCDFFVVF